MLQICGEMFEGCTLITNLDISNFNTSKTTDMNFMFNNCKNLEKIDISSATFENVTKYVEMFKNIKDGATIIVKDTVAQEFVQARLSEVSKTAIVQIKTV